MSYDANVQRRAAARLDQERRRRQERTERLRLEAYEKEPRLERLDRRIQATMAGLVAAALRRGGDPVQAVRAVREENQDLQRERAVLLGAMGLPEDALDDKPACPLCRDTGWQGAKMCRCLRQLCAQEQIRCPDCWIWGSSPSTPSAWTTTARPPGPPRGTLPEAIWSWSMTCA